MKRLLILSGKGGTGKTTVSAALIRLAQARAVADCDVDAPNLHLLMQQSVQPEVYDFIGGVKAQVDTEKCIGCGKCDQLCRFDAIHVQNDKATINEYACEGCGVCDYVCPVKAVTLVPDVAGRRELYLDENVFSTATLKMGRGTSGKLVADVKMAMLKAAPDCALAIVDGSPGIGCPVIASIIQNRNVVYKRFNIPSGLCIINAFKALCQHLFYLIQRTVCISGNVPGVNEPFPEVLLVD